MVLEEHPYPWSYVSLWLRNTCLVVLQEEEEDAKDKKGKDGKAKTKKPAKK